MDDQACAAHERPSVAQQREHPVSGRAGEGFHLVLPYPSKAARSRMVYSQAVLDERLVLVTGTALEAYYREQLLPPFATAYGEIAAACVQLSRRVAGAVRKPGDSCHAALVDLGLRLLGYNRRAAPQPLTITSKLFAVRDLTEATCSLT